MDLSLRIRLSVMMFLQYFVWGTWGVVIFTFISKLPTEGGLNFPGVYGGWIEPLPIGAMISPIFIGLFADRLFASERVLGVLHLLGAVLLAWAGYTCEQRLPQLQTVFDAAAKAEKVGEGNLLEGLKREKEFQTELDQADPAKKPELAKELKAFQEEQLKPAMTRVNDNAEVKETTRSIFLQLFGILLGYAICFFMPTITLTNSLSFRNLSDPDKYFGGIRVLGTIAWIVAGNVVAFRLNVVSSQPLYLAAGTSVLLGLFCFALPHTPPAGGAKSLSDTLGLPALALLKEPAFLVFVVCSFLIMIVLAFYFQLGNPFLDAIQIPYPTAVQTLGQVSEIFFMFVIPIGLAWLGTKGMLLIGYLAWCLRYAIFASQNVPAVVALGLPLHGICYDFFFVVSYLYVDRKAPQHLRASAQGMITFVTLGVGWFIGNLLAGEVKQKYTVGDSTDWTQVWLFPLAGSIAATVLFFLLFKDRKGDGRQVTASNARDGLDPAESPRQAH